MSREVPAIETRRRRRPWWRSLPGLRTGSSDRGEIDAEDELLSALLRREDSVLKDETLKQQAGELDRQRRELLAELDVVIGRLSGESQNLSSRIEVLSVAKGKVAELPDKLAWDDGGALGLARRTVESGRLEIAKIAKQHDASARGDNGSGLASLGFVGLTSVGLGLLWPVILAVLVVGVGIGWVLVWLFRIG